MAPATAANRALSSFKIAYLELATGEHEVSGEAYAWEDAHTACSVMNAHHGEDFRFYVVPILRMEPAGAN